MDVHDKIMLRKRNIIETINDMLKNVAQIVHTRHRSISNYCCPVKVLHGNIKKRFYKNAHYLCFTQKRVGKT